MDERELNGKLSGYRRDLHRIPELGRDLPKTTAYIREHLAKLPCDLREAGDAGFCAIFHADEASEAKPIAFRTDMDALPIQETTDFTFASEHAGQMHACGHDGHMAIMLGFADRLAEMKAGKALKRDAVLIFQAAEESIGGAKDLCDSGILQECKVSAVYGIHLWPGYSKGEIVCRCGEFMSSTMVFQIEVKGKSAHVGSYKKGIDALEIGCDFVRRVYEMEKDEVAPDVHRLLRFGIMKSGSAPNVVANHAYLEGTLRTYSKGVSDFMWGRMTEIASDLEVRTGASISLSHSEPYPAVINPEDLFAKTRKALLSSGYSFTEPELPLMISEDFSFYQQSFPAVFLHLATGFGKPLHCGDYTIEEDVLITGVRIYETLLDRIYV